MIDDRPQILVELGTELDRAAARTLSSTNAVHPRGAFPRRRAALSLTALVAAGALVFTLALSGHGNVTGGFRSTPSGPLALDTAFVVLRRPAHLSDRLPGAELHFLQEHSHAFRIFSLDAARSRRVVTTANVSVWLVPGPKDVCLVGFVSRPAGADASFPVGCNPANTAERYGMIGVFGDTLAGVLPSGSADAEAVGRDRHTTALRLTEGAFAFPLAPQELPLNVDYTDPAGGRQQFYLPAQAAAAH